MPRNNTKKASDITEAAGDTQSAGDAASSQGDIRELLGGIRSEVAALRVEILTELKSSISAVKTSLLEQEQKLKDVEESLTDVDGRVTALESTCSALSKDNEKLRIKLDDLENRSRRNNIRVIGIPEGSEGSHPSAFIEALVLEVFGEQSFSKKPEVDRAHRSLAPPPKANQAPRPFIVRMHHYQMRELILRLAREKGQVLYKGLRIHFYPDVSADVAKRRAAFNQVKAELRGAGIEFGLLFPARLRINHDGTKTFFDSPQRALEFVRRIAPPSTSE